jgi:hypothetical protein
MGELLNKSSSRERSVNSQWLLIVFGCVDCVGVSLLLGVCVERARYRVTPFLSPLRCFDFFWFGLV